jgi:diguanylate cyclase (GGDEF)-like protein
MLPFLVLLATIGLSSRALRESEASAAQVRHAYALRESINVVLSDLVDAETGVRGYLLTGKEDFLEPYWRGSDGLNVDVYLLESEVGDTRDGRTVHLRELISHRLALLDRLRVLGDDGFELGPSTMSALRTGLDVGNKIRALLTTMTAEQETEIARSEDAAASSRHSAFLLAVVGTPLAMFLALVAVLVVNGRLVRRLTKLEANARRLERGEPMEHVRFSDDEVGKLERALIQSGTVAIELRADLERLATVDPLTGLANRRGFMPLLELQVERSKRHHEPMCLMFLDLDGLKSVNDQLGHPIGDEMLCETAALLGDTFRASDVIARVGGDEFCVLLSPETAASSEVAIDRFKTMLRATNALPGRPYRLAVSFGLARIDPERPSTAAQLMTEADRLMYEHKRGKRQLAERP